MPIINSWARLGMVLSIFYFIGVELRYFVMYPDLDRAVAYGLIGVLLFGLSWAYDRINFIRDRQNTIEEYLADKNLEDKE